MGCGKCLLPRRSSLRSNSTVRRQPLDGCSTSDAVPGRNPRIFPKSDYLGLDINPKYIDQASDGSASGSSSPTSLATNSPRSGPFDFILVNSLLHHLETQDGRLLAPVARHLDDDGHVHILDLVQPKRPGAARLLARWDRGDYPRPLGDWETLFSEAFEPVILEPYPLPRRPRPGTWCTSRVGRGDDRRSSDFRGDRAPERGAGHSGALATTGRCP